MNSLSIHKALTMSSLEIASLCGKRHDNVRSDIAKMADELSLKIQEKPESSNGGRPSMVYHLNRRECDILVAGYSIKYRAIIVDRWHELEAQQQPKLPTTYLEALEALVETEKRAQEAERTKAHINDKRTATLMNKASQDAKKIKKLESKLQDVGTYRSQKAEGLPDRVDTELKDNVQTWRILKAISADMGHDIKKVDDSNYGTVNAYHIDVIKRFKEDYL